MMSPIKVSLIVCSRNRAALLPEFFSHVRGIAFPADAWELIFVDNGSSDDTERVVKDEAQSLACRWHYVLQPVKGLSNARNAGIAGASGEILVFTDDDCHATPDLLASYVALYESKAIGFAGGRVSPFSESTPDLSMQESAETIRLPPGEFLYAGLIHGANMSVRREVPAQIGGFDPLLGAGAPLISADDTEYLARARFAGYEGLYSPLPTVIHAHLSTTVEEEQRIRDGYLIGTGAYYARMLLSASSRRVYAKRWYWGLREKLLQGLYWRAFLELRGGAGYLWHRILGWGKASHRKAADHSKASF